MGITEHTMNDALARALRGTRHAWRKGIVSSENTGMLKGGVGRPDILVIEANVAPVVVETEVLPANTVEADALARLGAQLAATGRRILSAIAVRLPKRLRMLEGESLFTELQNANDFEMALFTGNNPSDFTRCPHSGWISGNVADLSVLTQSASVPPDVIAEASNKLVTGVSEGAGLLTDMAQQHSGALRKIAEELRQEDGEQTRRMAITILANAFVFHGGLAGGPGGLQNVKSLDELEGSGGGLLKSVTLAEWRKILEINYWPIFDIARRILEIIPTPDSKRLIRLMATTAEKLLENRLMRSHDLTGAVFQQLIADRKFLAAFYTTPASAALLVGLTITPNEPVGCGAWSDAQALKKLRIADFACGTGTLLSTAYQRIGQLYELAGGDAEALHPTMMASVFVGSDVLPAAAHLTASMLSGTYPTVKYQQSAIMTVAYGKQKGGGVALGSLDLLDPQGALGVLAITAKLLEAAGEAEKDTWLSLKHGSFDWIIRNPPFTRATGHEGNKIGVPNPMFAAFSSSEEEQRLMSKATQELTRGTSGQGNAGEASYFLVLADRMLKPGGKLSLVMPLSLVSGDAWDKSRTLLATGYKDLIVVSIAGALDADLSFSADTGMGECLVAGQKVEVMTVMTASRKRPKRATFVVLRARPESPLAGASAARQIRRLIDEQQIRRLEDGPLGGTLINFGDDLIGHCLDAPLSTSGGWNLARIADLSLAQTAYQLTDEHRIWLPTMTEKEAIRVGITTVGLLGDIGPYHMDINADTPSGGIRGPFTISPIRPNSAPTYPVLWSHSAGEQRTMSFEAEAEGIPRKGSAAVRAIIARKIADVWATASHCHFNRDFRFNSQCTGMQFTPRQSIGGRAWLSIRLASTKQEKALVLWGNTSLGLLLHWWHANKQQAGRGSIGKAALGSLPVLDVRALKANQLAKSVSLFDSFKDKPLRPIHEIDVDAVRQELDKQFFGEVLGASATVCAAGGPLELLWKKLAVEPSIRGAK